jgi:hypothetical protein
VEPDAADPDAGPTHDERYAQWWEEYQYLYGFVILLHTRNQMWAAIDAELVRTQQPGSGFVQKIFNGMYGEAQGVLVRRLLDDDSQSRSIRRLVGHMAEHHKVLTRDRYVSEWQSDRHDEAHASFDTIAGKGSDYVPRGYVLQLCERIIASGVDLIESINQIVAHDQREKTAQPFTYGLLDRASTELSREFIEVGKLLRGGSWNDPVPMLPPEWKQPFKFGLFGPGAPNYDSVHFIQR